MTLADVPCWLAVLSLLGADDVAVTVGMTTSFLAGARTGLRCDSQVVHGAGEWSTAPRRPRTPTVGWSPSTR
jgi:acyl-coenzyme A thioesterase PaaI-like protein